MRYKSILNTIGETPLIRIKNICGSSKLFAKAECFNPGGSIKDRVALALIKDAEERGKIKEGTIIIESTSGNTGIGLAMVCAAKAYPLILTMPDTVSQERRQILSGFGAKLVLASGKQGMKSAIEEAQKLSLENPNSFIPSQFTNPVVPLCHFEHTASEIWRDTGGDIDILVAGVGTGGTLTGSARFLKMCKPSIKIVAVEPYNSAVITQTLGKKEIKIGPHRLQGIGAGFLPKNLDLSLIDEVFRVKDKDAFNYMRKLMKEEGLFAGITSGAAAFAALEIASREENKNKTIVFIAPDTGERYLSEKLF